jgi:hypothetical protein
MKNHLKEKVEISPKKFKIFISKNWNFFFGELKLVK